MIDRQAIWNTAYLSLGANLGDRLATLRQALFELACSDDIRITAASSIYETDPVGLEDQPPFLNAVIAVSTTLQPLDLLHRCQDIENRFQRERNVRWGPRTLDIDMLIYENIVMETPELTLPHPRMTAREFVTIPLRELETGEIGRSAGVRPIDTNWTLR